MASASESGDGAASCDLAGRFSSCSSMKSGAPGDATWRRLALVIVTNSVGLVLVRQKRPACGARGMRARALRRSPGTTWQVSHASGRTRGERAFLPWADPTGQLVSLARTFSWSQSGTITYIYDGKKHTYKREREVSEASVGEGQGDKGAKKKR